MNHQLRIEVITRHKGRGIETEHPAVFATGCSVAMPPIVPMC